MAMILKSLFTLILTVCFAGGAVYFGTKTGEPIAKIQQNTVSQSAQKIAQKLSSRKTLGLSFDHPHKSADPQSGFLETLNKNKPKLFKPEVNKPKQIQTEKNALKLPQTAEPRIVKKPTKLSTILRSMSDHKSENLGNVKAEPENKTPAYEIIDIQPSDPVVPPIIVELPKPTAKITPTSDLKAVELRNAEHERLIQTVMSEIKAIKSPELKDQAYLDVVNYATERGHFEAADTALSLIVQPELRDTARGQMAVFLARTGQTKRAFSIIDDVEIEALRDVLRLQTIEAIVLPPQYRSLPALQAQ